MPVPTLIVVLSLAAGTATDDFTENERLYLTMLVEGRDAWADNIKRKIGQCEQELERRKHPKRAARRAPSEDSSGFVVVGNLTSTKEIESKMRSFKQELEQIESGSSVPEDRFWDPQIFTRFGRLGGDIRVIQVIGPSEMLVDMTQRHPLD
jgi:hypothetical protein